MTMTDQEAVDLFLEKTKLEVWQRLVFFFILCIFGCYFLFPIGWVISPTTTQLIIDSLVIPFLFLLLLWNVIVLPKFISAIWTLRKLGYKKWRRFYWVTMYKCLFQNLKPTLQERLYFPWLWPFTIFSFTFPIFSLIIFAASLFFLP